MATPSGDVTTGGNPDSAKIAQEQGMSLPAGWKLDEPTPVVNKGSQIASELKTKAPIQAQSNGLPAGWSLDPEPIKSNSAAATPEKPSVLKEASKSFWQNDVSGTGHLIGGVMKFMGDLMESGHQFLSNAPANIQTQAPTIAPEISSTLKSQGQGFVDKADEYLAGQEKPTTEGMSAPARIAVKGAGFAGGILPIIAASPVLEAMGPGATPAIASVFGAQAYEDTKQAMIQNGATPEIAHKAATIDGILNFATMAVMGPVSKYLTGVTGGATAEAVGKEATETAIAKPFLKQAAIAQGVAIPAMGIQGAGSQAVQNEYNPNPQTHADVLQAAIDSMEGATGFAILSAPMGLYARAQNAKQATLFNKVLNNTEAPDDIRTGAAATLMAQMSTVDPVAAKTWGNNAALSIAKKEPIAMSGDAFTVERTPAAEQTTPTAETPITPHEQAIADAEILNAGKELPTTDESRVKNATLVAVMGDNKAVEHAINSGNKSIIDSMLQVSPRASETLERLKVKAAEAEPTAMSEAFANAKAAKSKSENVTKEQKPEITTDNTEQAIPQKEQSAVKSYVQNLLHNPSQSLIDKDIALNKLLGGENETISARIGKSKDTNVIASVLAKTLDNIDPGHIERALADVKKEAVNPELVNRRNHGEEVSVNRRTRNQAGYFGGVTIEQIAESMGTKVLPEGEVAPSLIPKERGPTTTESVVEQAKAHLEIIKNGENPNKGNLIKAEKALNAAKISEASKTAAHSAENPLPLPTEGQINAGNYPKGHVSLNGLDVTIENPRGSTRTGVQEGKPWQVKMQNPYGYIRKTEGADGDHMDVYLGDHITKQSPVFVIDQIDPKTKQFDEHKVIYGARGYAEAKDIYDNHFSDKSGPNRRGSITKMPLDEFKDWIKGDTTQPLKFKEASQNKTVNFAEDMLSETKALTRLAHQKGFKDIDDFAKNDAEEFRISTEKWRNQHPIEQFVQPKEQPKMGTEIPKVGIQQPKEETNVTEATQAEPKQTPQPQAPIRAAVETLVKYRRFAQQAHLGIQLDKAIVKAKAALTSGEGDPAVFMKAAAPFKKEHPEAYNALKSIADSVKPIELATKQVGANLSPTEKTTQKKELVHEAQLRGLETFEKTADELKADIAAYDEKNGSLNIEQKTEEYNSNKFDPSLKKEAEQHFGITHDPQEAGYIMRDGTMLDLSGRNEATGYEKTKFGYRPIAGQQDYLRGQRAIDHRDLPESIINKVGGEGSTDSMLNFQKQSGALRYMDGQGISANFLPTRVQVEATMRAWNANHKGESLFVDVDHPQTGNTILTHEFEKPSVDKIIDLFKSAKDREGKSVFISEEAEKQKEIEFILSEKAAIQRRGKSPNTTGMSKSEISAYYNKLHERLNELQKDGQLNQKEEPYASAPDSLLGYKRNGPQTPYEESNYKKEITVKVNFENGESMIDGMRGLNTSHAMERARRNWKDAKIELISDKPYHEYANDHPELNLKQKEEPYNETHKENKTEPDIYEGLPVREGTTEKQKQLGRDAYRDILGPYARRAGSALLGSRIAKDFKEEGGSSLHGQVAKVPEDFAVLAQILRDPRIEKFRIFYTKNGKIVGHDAFTSNAPGSVAIIKHLRGESDEEAVQRTLNEMYDAKQRLSADGYWLLHNHPSGRAVPSPADQMLTKRVASGLPGFLGHIVIDHNEYAHIDADGQYHVTQKQMPEVFNKNIPEVPHNALGMTLDNKEDVIEVSKMLENKEGYFSLIGRTARGEVASLAEFPRSLLDEGVIKELRLHSTLRRFAAQTGSTDVIAVTDRTDISRMEQLVQKGLLMDAVDTKGYSARDYVSSSERVLFKEKKRYQIDQPTAAYGKSHLIKQGEEKEEPAAIEKVKTFVEKVKVGFTDLAKAYTAAPEFTESKKIIGEYTGKLQEIDYSLSKLAKSINKEFKPERQEAITNYIQAGGDEKILRERSDKSPVKFKQGYEDALKLTPKEKELADFIQTQQDDYWHKANEAGIIEHYIENYVRGQWERENPAGQKIIALVNSGMLNDHPKEAMRKVFQNYAEGEQAGYIPTDKRIGFQFVAGNRSIRAAIAAREALTSLMHSTEKDGRPTVAIGGGGSIMEPGSEEKPYFVKPNIKPKDAQDYRTIDHPAMRGWKWVGSDAEGKPILMHGQMYIHPEAYRKLNALLGKSIIRNYEIPKSVPVVGGTRPGEAMLKTGAFIKSTILIGPFHQFHLGEHAVFHKVNPFNPPEIDFNERPLLREGVYHGLMLYNHNAMHEFAEGLASGGLWHRLPVVGDGLKRYQEWLFQDYIPRLKASMYEAAFARNMEIYAGKIAQGKINRDQIAEVTAKESNAAFGEQNYKYLARDPSYQDALRIALLAPDFLEARFKFFGQAVRPYGREQMMALVRAAAIMSLGAQTINMMFGDNHEMHWDRPFSVIVDGREYSPRSVIGDIAHLVTDPRGFWFHRINPLWGRPLYELSTGRNMQGQKETVDEGIANILKSWVPIPAQGIFKTQPEQSFMQSFTNTLLTSIGVSNFQTKSPAEKMIHDFNFDKLPQVAMTDEQIAKRKAMREIEAKLRNNEPDKAQELFAKQQAAHVLSAGDYAKAVRLSIHDPMVNAFKHLDYAEATKVWEVADEEEKKKLSLVYTEKKINEIRKRATLQMENP